MWLHGTYAYGLHSGRVDAIKSGVTSQPLTPVQSAEPPLTLVTRICGGGSCPTVYRTDRDTYVVQGYVVTAEVAGVDLPAGEQLVEIPRELLAEALRAGG
jgi:hypothetical protein